MIKRLKKMRASRPKRTEAQCQELFNKIKALARNARLDWSKAKVRWFTDVEEIEKIRANRQVEKNIGYRSDAQLWKEHDLRIAAYRDGVDDAKMPPRYIESMERWNNQVNPMMIEDLLTRQGQDSFNENSYLQIARYDDVPEGKEELAEKTPGLTVPRVRLIELTKDENLALESSASGHENTSTFDSESVPAAVESTQVAVNELDDQEQASDASEAVPPVVVNAQPVAPFDATI